MILHVIDPVAKHSCAIGAGSLELAQRVPYKAGGKLVEWWCANASLDLHLSLFEIGNAIADGWGIAWDAIVMCPTWWSLILSRHVRLELNYWVG